MSRTKEFYHDEIYRNNFINQKFLDDTYRYQEYQEEQILRTKPLSVCCDATVSFFTALPNISIPICTQCHSKCEIH